MRPVKHNQGFKKRNHDSGIPSQDCTTADASLLLLTHFQPEAVSRKSHQHGGLGAVVAVVKYDRTRTTTLCFFGGWPGLIRSSPAQLAEQRDASCCVSF